MPIGGFTDDWQVSQFKSRVREFKDCIELFVGEQERAAKRHMQAADEAIEEWNNFINYEIRR